MARPGDIQGNRARLERAERGAKHALVAVVVLLLAAVALLLVRCFGALGAGSGKEPWEGAGGSSAVHEVSSSAPAGPEGAEERGSSSASSGHSAQDGQEPASGSSDTVGASSQTATQAETQAASQSSSQAAAFDALGDAVMGQTYVSAHAMARVYEDHGAPYPADVYAEAGAATIEEFCQLCVAEATAEGVRAEVLFAQAMHETAWLQFGNQVSVEQCNFGGIGAVNSGGAGESFPDVRTGLRAQVQHLKAYASTEELESEVVDPRFDLVERGVAPRVEDLAGRWAWPGDGYADAIMGIVELLQEAEWPDAAEAQQDSR